MSASEPTTFAIQCACGVWSHSTRQPVAQILKCSGCNRRIFVFPDSPSMFGARAIHGGVGAKCSWRRVWFTPIAASILALGLVGLVVTAIVRGHRGDSRSAAGSIVESQAGRFFEERLAAAKVALDEGSYRQARDELTEAQAIYARFPQAIPRESARQVSRWRRQVELLVDLSSESIGEIVRHSVGRTDREWEAVFRDRYQGKAIVLDTRVFRDASGHYHLDYRLEGAGGLGEWEFDRFRLFENLNLQQPQRLFFGFRLHAIRKPARDRWAVVPESDSGVLFDDPSVLIGLSVPVDAELIEVLRRQARWESNP